MVFSDGKQYIGDFDCDVRHGKGKFMWTDGRVYDGGWVNGKQFGVAFYTDKHGIKKKGRWEDGKRVEWIEE